VICAGIDAGSRAIKIVLMDGENQNIVASGSVYQGVEQGRLVSELLDQLVEQAGIGMNDIGKIIATGYGRDGLEIADKTVTEIACHARGVFHQTPGTMTVIDIGVEALPNIEFLNSSAARLSRRKHSSSAVYHDDGARGWHRRKRPFHPYLTGRLVWRRCCRTVGPRRIRRRFSTTDWKNRAPKLSALALAVPIVEPAANDA